MKPRDHHARLSLVQLSAMSAIEFDWQTTAAIKEYLADAFVGYRQTAALRILFQNPMRRGWVEARQTGGGVPNEYRLTPAGREVLARALFAMGAAQ